MDSEENNSEVTIRSSAKVEGGTTCAPCVDRNMLNITLLIASTAHHYSCHDVNM
jgi:hypothetical protein